MYCPISNENYEMFYGDSKENNEVCRANCEYCTIYQEAVKNEESEEEYNEQ